MEGDGVGVRARLRFRWGLRFGLRLRLRLRSRFLRFSLFSLTAFCFGDGGFSSFFFGSSLGAFLASEGRDCSLRSSSSSSSSSQSSSSSFLDSSAFLGFSLKSPFFRGFASGT